MNNQISNFRWYLASVASYTMPQGIMSVLFPYLVAVYLAETPERVGQAQMMLMLPALLLLLPAGVLADRIDQRRMLMTLHLINVVPVSCLLLALYLDQISYGVMLLFALASGTVNSLVQPARDAMLNRISGPDIQRTVTVTVGFTFGTQLLGYMLASSTDLVGPIPLLMFFIVVMGSGIWLCSRLPRAQAESGPGGNPFAQVAEGIKLVLQSPRMLPAWILVFFVGLFFGGAYVVLVPLTLRDVYDGGASDIAFAFAAFMAGTVVSTGLLLRMGGVRRPGRACIVGLLLGACAIGSLNAQLPYWGFLVAIAIWGLGGGITMSMSRTIMQESAPATHRARVMSVYSLGNLGAIPLGSLAMGHLVALVGPVDAALMPALGVLAVLVVMVTVTGIWNDQRPVIAVDIEQPIDTKPAGQ